MATQTESPTVEEPLSQLADLLCARRQLEQLAAHLYDALLAKLDSQGEPPAGPTRLDVIELRNDELAHARLVESILAELGADPAMVTPAARREAIMIRGVRDVVTDSASTVLDVLEAMTLAELADHEQWVGLVELTRELGREDLARSFLTAQSTEHTHLSKMRAWISAGRAATRPEVH